jgi:methylated-DNA-[protein]-cysteine S-methyltransferase
MFYGTYASSVGELTLAFDGGDLVGLWIAGQKHFGRGGDRPDSYGGGEERVAFEQVRAWLDRYFAGGR